MKLWTLVFGAKAQVVIGVVTFLMGVAFWAYIESAHHGDLSGSPLVAAIFRVSMFFGLVACYAIIATGLGYRATERVEAHVAGDMEIEHADQVNVNRAEPR